MPGYKIEIQQKSGLSHTALSEGKSGLTGRNPYPVDTSAAIEAFFHEYASKQQSIPISIRELVGWMKVGERSTHYIHPYPAKLLPQIAHFFFASQLLAPTGATVLDPFAGSGTVPLEAMLSGRAAIYADANPLARLITKVKTQPIPDPIIERYTQRILSSLNEISPRHQPDVINIEKWFGKEVICILSKIRGAINDIDNISIRDFMFVTFSAVARKASNADLRFPVPVKRRDYAELKQSDVIKLFETQLDANRSRLRHFDLSQFTPPRPGGVDARALQSEFGGGSLPDSSVDLILTSPPYAGAQKYVRATSLSLGWLGLAPSNGLRQLEDLTIGREHYSKAHTSQIEPSGIVEADNIISVISETNPLRAKIASMYLYEMRLAFHEAVRVLKPDGYFVLIVGDNTVCGYPFRTSEYLKTILEDLGLTTALWLIDPIRSRRLMTRRATSAGIIAHESVMVFKKLSSRT